MKMLEIHHWKIENGQRVGIDRTERIDPECIEMRKADQSEKARRRMGEIPEGYDGRWYLDSKGTCGCGC